MGGGGWIEGGMFRGGCDRGGVCEWGAGHFDEKGRCPAKVPEQQSGCEGSSGVGLGVVMRVASKVSSFTIYRFFLQDMIGMVEQYTI